MSLHVLAFQDRIKHETYIAPVEPYLAPMTGAELAPQAQGTPEQHLTPSFISRVKSFGNFLIGRHIAS